MAEKNVETTTSADVTPQAGHTTWDDIPSSHDTCGENPVEEVAATYPDADETPVDVPSSNETSGDDPLAEVAATHDDAAEAPDKADKAPRQSE